MPETIQPKEISDFLLDMVTAVSLVSKYVEPDLDMDSFKDVGKYKSPDLDEEISIRTGDVESLKRIVEKRIQKYEARGLKIAGVMETFNSYLSTPKDKRTIDDHLKLMNAAATVDRTAGERQNNAVIYLKDAYFCITSLREQTEEYYAVLSKNSSKHYRKTLNRIIKEIKGIEEKYIHLKDIKEIETRLSLSALAAVYSGIGRNDMEKDYLGIYRMASLKEIPGKVYFRCKQYRERKRLMKKNRKKILGRHIS